MMRPRSRRVPSLSFVLALAALCAAGCGDGDDGGGGGGGPDAGRGAGPDAAAQAAVDAAVATFERHIIQRSCAPDDGPALTLALGAAHDPETCTIDFDQPAAILSVYLSAYEVEAPATFTFDDETFAGSGLVCAGGDAPCAQATAGELRIESYEEDVGASGRWELTTEQYGTVTGAFDATWCTPEGGGPFCG